MKENLMLSEHYSFSLNGENLLLNVNSGMCFRVDEVTSHLIDGLREGEGIDEVKRRCTTENIDSIIEELKLAGFFKEKEESSPSLPNLNGREEISIIALNVAQDCNLRCRYCYGGGGTYGGGRTLMDELVAKEAVDFLFHESRENRDLAISFFGGEPLINFGVIKSTVDYCREKERETGKEVKFYLSTNGILLNKEIIDFLGRADVEVHVSIDGPPEIHDRMRLTRDGGGTYKHVVDGIKRLSDSKVRFSARATLTKEFINLKEVVLHLLGLGFPSVNVLPSIGGNGFDLNPEDIKTLKAQYTDFADYFIERIEKDEFIGFANFVMEVRKTKVAGQKRFYPCGAGRNYVCITPDGGIYLCHRFANREEFRMGNLQAGFNRSLGERISELHVDNRPGCRTCWARYFCGGGCYFASWVRHKNIDQPDELQCELKRHLIELALYINSALDVSEEEVASLPYGE